MSTDLPPDGGHSETGPPSGQGAGGTDQATGAPTPPYSPQPGHHDHGAHIFDRIRDLGAYRSERDRYGAGVAGGLARRWGVDPLLIRIGFVVLTVVGGAGVLLYGLGWMFMPQEDGRIHAQQLLRGNVSSGFFGALVVILLGLGADGGPGPWGRGWGFPGGLALSVLIVVGVIFWVNRADPGGRRRPNPTNWSDPPTPPDPQGEFPVGTYTDARTESGAPPVYGTPSGPYAQNQPAPLPYRPTYEPVLGPVLEPVRPKRDVAPSRPLRRLTLGVAVLAGVAGYLLAQPWHTDGESVLIGMAAALAAVGAGAIVAGLLGRRAGFPGFLGVLLVAAVILGTSGHSEGVGHHQSLTVAGDRLWSPELPGQAADGVSQGVGQLTVRLTGTQLFTGTGTVDVPVRMGAGRMVIYLPDSVPARVEIDQGGGQVRDASGNVQDGRTGAGSSHLTYSTGPTGQPRLLVRVRQGAGEIEMYTAAIGSQPTANTGTSATPSPSASATPSPSASATPSPSATTTPTGA